MGALIYDYVISLMCNYKFKFDLLVEMHVHKRLLRRNMGQSARKFWDPARIFYKWERRLLRGQRD